MVLPSYNGARRGPNLTAFLAMLLVRYGVPVLVHGLAGASDDEVDDEGVAGAHGSYGRVTTAQVLWDMGVAPCTTTGEVEDRLARAGIAYAPTSLLSPGLDRLLATRSRLGLRTTAHSLVKVIDPFSGEGVRVISVSHPGYVRRMRDLVAATSADAMILGGTEGEPYANPKRCPRIEVFRRGALARSIDGDEGAVEVAAVLPASSDAATTAAWIEGALAGTEPIPAPILQQLGCLLESARESAPQRVAA